MDYRSEMKIADDPELDSNREMQQYIVALEVWKPFMRLKSSRKAYRVVDVAGWIVQGQNEELTFVPVHKSLKSVRCTILKKEVEEVCRDSFTQGHIILATGVLSIGGFDIFSVQKWADVYAREHNKEKNADLSKEQLEVVQLRCAHLQQRRLSEKNHGGILFSEMKTFRKLIADYPELYPSNIKQLIERMFTRLESVGSSSDKNEIYRALQFLTNIDYYDTWHIQHQESCITKFMQCCYGHEEAKAVLSSIISQRAVLGHTTTNNVILLVGPDGSGKGCIANGFFNAVHLPVITVTATKADPSGYVGSASVYNNSQMGSIAREMMEANTKSVGIYLKGVDHMPPANVNGSMPELVDALVDGHLNDDSMAFPISLENSIVIATASSIECVPRHLRERMTVIELSAYSEKDKAILFSNYIFPAALSEAKLSGKVRITPDAIELIAAEYANHCGATDLEMHAKTLANYANKQLWKMQVTDICIDKQIVRAALKKPPQKRPKNIDQLRHEYNENPQRYSPQIEEAIQNLLADYLDETRQSERSEIVDVLDYLIPVDWVCGTELPQQSLKQLNAILDEAHVGHSNVKKELLGVIAEMRRTGKRPQPILFAGPPGTGKTDFCKGFASAIGKPFQRISLGGETQTFVINGSKHTVSEALPGEPVQAVRRVKTTDCVLCLDEVDKLCESSSHGDPAAALLSLLDNMGFRDNFIGDAELDFSKTIFFATANDLSQIPRALRDRFQIITMPGYTATEKRSILEQATIPKCYKTMKLSVEEVKWDESATKLITAKYSVTPGARDLEQIVRKILRQALVEIEEDVNACPFFIDKAFVIDCMGAPVERNSFPKKDRPGVARVLAVSGYGGCSFPVEATVTPAAKPEMIITGLPHEEVRDSCAIADHIARQWLSENGVVDADATYKVWMHWGDAGVEKSGPSAGVAATISLVSAYTGIPAPSNCSYTGEINLGGDVCVVGGLKEKLTAAVQAGCTTAYIPADRLDNELRSELEEIMMVVPVNNLREVLEAVFPQVVSKKHLMSAKQMK